MSHVKAALAKGNSGAGTTSQRIAAFCFEDSMCLFVLAIGFEIIGAIWVFVFLPFKDDHEKGCYIFPMKELLVFAIVPRTIISMKRLAAESRTDYRVNEKQPFGSSAPLPSNLAPASPAHPLIRHRSWCSLTVGSTTSPKFHASTPGRAPEKALALPEDLAATHPKSSKQTCSRSASPGSMRLPISTPASPLPMHCST